MSRIGDASRWAAGLYLIAVGACVGEAPSITSVLHDASPAERRAELHKSIQQGEVYVHDAAIGLISFGDETSVPYLIEALKLFPYCDDASTPTVCTQSHCIEALHTITNQDVGLNYEDWQAWWTANQSHTHGEWVADGFRQLGLPVTSPPDGAYVSALIQQMAHESSYLAKNAWEILDTVKPELLWTRLELASRSDVPEDRLAAIVALSRLNTEAAGARLIEMTKDSDADVRESALTKANAYRRGLPVLAPEHQVNWRGSLGDSVAVVGAGTDSDHVFVGYEGVRRMGDASHLASFNLVTKRADWVRSVSSVVNSVPLIHDDRVYFTCQDGAVYCVGVRSGDVIWTYETNDPSYTNPRNKLVFVDGTVVTTMETRIFAFDCATGDLHWALAESPEMGDLEYTAGSIYIASAAGAFVRISPTGELLCRKPANAPRLLGSKGDTVFGTVGGYPSTLVALSCDSLAERWRQDLGGGDVTSVQTDTRLVIGVRNSRYFGIEMDTGEVLWSTLDHWCQPLAVVGDRFVTSNGRFRVELRNIDDGQVSMSYDEPAILPNPLYVTPEIIVTGAMHRRSDEQGDNLWVLNVPKRPVLK